MSTLAWSNLHGSLTHQNHTLYPPKTKTLDFERQRIIFVHIYESSEDESISQSFFSLFGSWGNAILFLCPWEMYAYPSQFEDVDSAINSL